MQRPSAINDALDQVRDPTDPDSAEWLARVRIERGVEQVRRRRHERPDPPHAPDRSAFGAVEGLPEIDRRHLDLDHLASGIQHHGALVVRGLFDHATVDRLRAELDRTENRRRQRSTHPGGVRPGPGLRALKVSPRGLELLLDAYERAGLTELVRQYLGEVPVLAANRTRLRRDPAIHGGLPWHQDAVFHLYPTQGVNVWTALTPVGEDRPGLELVPDRQPGTLGYDQAELSAVDGVDLDYAKELPDDLPALARGGDRVERPVLDPGDAVVFDDLTLHRTGTQPWQASQREVAVTWFFHPGRFPRLQVKPLAV